MMFKSIIVMSVFTTFVSCRPRSDSSSGQSTGQSTGIKKDQSVCIFDKSNSGRTDEKNNESLDPLTWQIIRSAALASQVASKDKKEIESQAKAWGYHKVSHITYKSLSGFLMSNTNCAVLAFASTNPFSIRDWIVDAKIGSAPVTHGNVHKGFHDGVINLWSQINGGLANHRVKNKTFWVTGHSLGGALAGLFAYKAELDGPEWKTPTIDHVITFGQPLFSDENVANQLRDTFVGRYYRVVNNADMVPRIPYWFYPAGSLLWFKDEQVEYRPDRLDNVGLNLSGKPKVVSASIPDELKPTPAALNEFIHEAERQNSQGDPGNQTPQPAGFFSVQRVVPKWIRDHFLDGYLEKIFSQLQRLGSDQKTK